MKASFWIGVAAVIFFALAVKFSSPVPNIADSDSLYHFGHSRAYSLNGIDESSFPWLTRSSIGAIGADLWYGFHILGIPLTYFRDPVSGIRFGEALALAAAIFIMAAAFARLGLKQLVLWLLLLIFASPNMFYRLGMFRPHPITLALTIFLFASFVAAPESRKNNYWPFISIFIAGFFISWLHISLSWVSVLIACATAIFHAVRRMAIPWRSFGAAAIGLALGWLLRPNPIGALKLAYIQIVQLALEKSRGTPLLFGREVRPMTWPLFAHEYIPIALIALLVLGAALWILIRNKEKTVLHVFLPLGVAVVFYFLAFTSAQRSMEYAVVFTVISAGFLYGVKDFFRKQLMIFFFALGFLYIVFTSISGYRSYIANAFYPAEYKESGEWLAANTKPGTVVFNIHWDQFGSLFFWAPNNYYINGMDPIFAYAHNPNLYWKGHFIAQDKAKTTTCGFIRCTTATEADTYQALKKEFDASYILVKKIRNPNFDAYLRTDDRYEKVFENDLQTIYRIL